ncbi:hypothetical protein GWI33_021591 [Rhynchophorus ferrugineus]|uniref:Uncharacterized protein n=1 Tax=Rhynchophorus ferrugineus TaxID=354439 RepID=A0A834MLQ5_RHYFE|nr:hypothetical protein GWI33_021591 [Rhynchophorus ferrugineus]
MQCIQLHKKLHDDISNTEKEALSVYSRRCKVLYRIGADVNRLEVDNVTISNNKLEATSIIREVPDAIPHSE